MQHFYLFQRTGSQEAYDLEYVGGSVPPSVVCSEGGDSLTDPGSVPAQDIMSPSSASSRTGKPPAKKTYAHPSKHKTLTQCYFNVGP